MPSNRRILEENYVRFSSICTDNNCSQTQPASPLGSFEGNITIPYVPIKPPADPPVLVIPLGSSVIRRKIAIILAVLSVLAACLFLLVYYSLVVQNRRRRRTRISNLNPNPDGNEDGTSEGGFHDHHVWYIRTVGLDQSLIDKITICPYKKGDGLFDGGTDCSVCLTEFDEGEFVRLLPKCGHAFHVSCIDTWLRAHVNCPLCRATIDVSPPITTAIDSNTTSDRELTSSPPPSRPLTQDLSSDETTEEEYDGSTTATAITIHPHLPPFPTTSRDLGRIGFHSCRRSISMDFTAMIVGGRESDAPGNSSCGRFAMEKEKQWCGPKRSYDLGMVRSLSTNGDESKLFVSRIGRGTRSNSSVLRR